MEVLIHGFLGSGQFGMFETTICAFVDEFPDVLRKRKTLFTAIMCGVLFLLGIPCITQGGMYILLLMDWYSGTFSLMVISFLEVIAIGWIYGVNRFFQDIYLMIHRNVCCWWKICWCYLTPITILCLLIFLFITHTPVSYGDYEYPQWSIAIGWMLVCSSIIPIPVIAIVEMARAEGSFRERLQQCLRPRPNWGPALEEDFLLYKKSLAGVPSRFPNTFVLDSNPVTPDQFGNLTLNDTTPFSNSRV